MTARHARPDAGQFTLDVSLLGRDYKIACDESEHAELAQAVAMLDRRMREIRDTRKVSSTERIAVMAALNFAHDLLRARKGAVTEAAAVLDDPPPATEAIDEASARRRIEAMRASIEHVLGGEEKLF